MSLSAMIGGPVRLIVLDDDPSFHDALASALFGHPDLKILSYTTNPRELELMIRQQAPDVVLVDHSLGRESGLKIGERLAKNFQAVMLFLVTDAPSRELWREAVASGFRGILRRPPLWSREELSRWVDGELAAVIREAIETDRRQLARLGSETSRNGFTGHGGMMSGSDGFHPSFGPGLTAPRVVAVWSAKGGVGKTSIAVNLALLAQAHPIQRIPTAILDLEEGAGATHALLDMPARPTTLEWMDHVGDDEVDPAAVMRRVAEHPTGLRAVFAPDSVGQSMQVDGKLARTIIRSLRATHGLVVIDCPPSLTEAVGAAMELATVILCVVTPELPTINKVHRHLEDLGREGLDLSKVRVVINRMPARPAISESEIATALSWVVVGSIPEDPGMHLAVNRRRPPALHDPSGPFMSGLRRAAAKIVPGLEMEAGNGRRGSLLGMLLGRR